MYAEYKRKIENQQLSSLEHNTATSTADMAAAGKAGLKTVLFIGSTREGRMGLRVAKFVKKQLEEANHSVDIFDPVEMPFTLLVKALHHYPNRCDAPAWLVAADSKLQEADAVVLVSAEYNHSIPPALSNMIAHFPMSSFAYKPSGLVCYSMGPYGGMRAAMQLRCLTGEIGCISVSNIFGIPVVQKALDEDGKPLNDFMVPGAQALIKQLDWHARAMKARRETYGLPK
jgi:NAD(P)H-dependent FMN reductase